MAEYIERKEIIKAIAAEACHCLTLNRPAEARGYIGAKELIERRKAADVAEVRHGRWIVTDVVTCSECRHFTKSEFAGRWNYCPNCGALMRGNQHDG